MARSKVNTQNVHLKYSTIISPVQKATFRWKGKDYEIIFGGQRSAESIMFKIVQMDKRSSIDTSLLTWLSLYFGEDAIAPNQVSDTRFNFNRGHFDFDPIGFTHYIGMAEKLPYKSYPIWRRELLNLALSYYMAAIRTGVNLMPVTIGLFATSVETIANVYYGKRDRYFTLGDNWFNKIIQSRLKRYKQSPNYLKKARYYEKYLKSEFELLKLMRNYVYGHSLTHLRDEKQKLVESLREWFIRHGASKKISTLSFMNSRLHKDLVREAFPLFKLGLRLNRLLLFYYLGFTSSIPFASHDFSLTGDLKKT